MNKLRVELKSEEELKKILSRLEFGFTIERVSRLYKKRDKSGYYVYLDLDIKETIVGRKKKFNKEQEKVIKLKYFQGMSLKKIADEQGCSKTLIYNIVNKE